MYKQDTFWPKNQNGLQNYAFSGRLSSKNLLWLFCVDRLEGWNLIEAELYWWQWLTLAPSKLRIPIASMVVGRLANQIRHMPEEIPEPLVLVESQYAPGIALLRLNRPGELNAINMEVIAQLSAHLNALEADDAVRVVVLTGNERAFAAGADIKEMAGQGSISMWQTDQFAAWDRIKLFKKPLIAAVSGFALGGGCELAMLCDMIVASESAQFGQPEIKIGVIPGAGGTQRLTRAVGKAKAMELIMSGKFIDAHAAERMGLVNKVVPTETYLHEAVRFAGQFVGMSALALRAAKDSVNAAYENHLQEALLHERKNFYLLFASQDQKEGMAAFVEKRAPKFSGK